MRRALWIAATILLAGCLSATNEAPGPEEAPATSAPLVDASVSGDMSFEVLDYSAPAVTLGGPDAEHSEYTYDEPLVGRAWIPDGEGPFPLLLFLHGQHWTCADPRGEEAFLGVDSCDDDEGVNSPYPNHVGYGYLGEFLAGHGYIVVSILGHETNQISNSVDDYAMWSRGELFLATHDALAADGLGILEPGILDLDRVGIMGHSRGGEGAATAAIVNTFRTEPVSLQGIVALAPSDFNDPVVRDVALMSLLPYCDGDVSTLHGAQTFDHARFATETRATPKVQVLVMGANHNHYNTAWGNEPIGGVVPDGDDAGTRTMGPCAAHDQTASERLSIEETLRQSIVHVGGFLRWTVGGEAGLAPYFTGAEGLPDAACPDTAPCDEAVHVSYQAGHDQRTTIWNASMPGATERHALGSLAAKDLDRFEVCLDDCPTGAWRIHDIPMAVVSWDGGGSITWNFDAPVAAREVLTFRAAVSPQEDYNAIDMAQDLSVIVTHTGNGATTTAGEHSRALYYPPGERQAPIFGGLDDTAKPVLNMVQIPLTGDGDITSITLRFDQTARGTLLLTDLQLQDAPET